MKYAVFERSISNAFGEKIKIDVFENTPASF